MRLLLLVYLLISYSVVNGQDKELEVEGGIKIGDVDSAPEPGTIRFNSLSKDFEGWNGTNWMSLTRLMESGEGVQDADGNMYKTVKIGHQEWMAENLKTSNYNDTTEIPHIETDLFLETSGAWTWYSNSIIFGNQYGKLYNWFAMETGKLCPIGWHVPTEDDWNTLADYLGGAEIAGGKMKEHLMDLWDPPNEGATNESGFTALPGGMVTSGDTYMWEGERGFWWTSEEVDEDNAAYRSLINGNVDLYQDSNDKNLGFSLRCIRD